MCVCIVRDGVQMVLLLGSHKENVFAILGMPESRTLFLGLGCEVSTPLCDEHVPCDCSSSFIRNHLAFDVFS